MFWSYYWYQVGYGKRIIKLGREIKDWGVWVHLKDTVDAFKKTMPLCIDLRNPAMRPRHWAQLMDVVGVHFDPEGEDFTLEKVRRRNIDQIYKKNRNNKPSNLEGDDLTLEKVKEREAML